MSTNALSKLRLALGLNDTKLVLTTKEQFSQKMKTGKFAVEATLLDGTTVQADSIEPGNVLSVIGEDGNLVPCGEGTYETDDCIIEVDGNGTISSVEPQEEATEGGETEEDDMKKTTETDGTSTDAPTDVTTTEGTDAVVDPMVSVLSAIKDLADKVEAISTDVATLKSAKESMKKVDVKKPGAEKITKAAFVKEDTVKVSNPVDQRLKMIREIAIENSKN